MDFNEFFENVSKVVADLAQSPNNVTYLAMFALILFLTYFFVKKLITTLIIGAVLLSFLVGSAPVFGYNLSESLDKIIHPVMAFVNDLHITEKISALVNDVEDKTSPAKEIIDKNQ